MKVQNIGISVLLPCMRYFWKNNHKEAEHAALDDIPKVILPNFANIVVYPLFYAFKIVFK